MFSKKWSTKFLMSVVIFEKCYLKFGNGTKKHVVRKRPQKSKCLKLSRNIQNKTSITAFIRDQQLVSSSEKLPKVPRFLRSVENQFYVNYPLWQREKCQNILCNPSFLGDFQAREHWSRDTQTSHGNAQLAVVFLLKFIPLQ